MSKERSIHFERDKDGLFAIILEEVDESETMDTPPSVKEKPGYGKSDRKKGRGGNRYSNLS